MNQLLTAGQWVAVGAGDALCRVEQLLGGGGQGEVYRASVDGHPLALKWYFPQTATRGQYEALALLVKKGPPGDRFLWPLDLARRRGTPGFGYVMPLREPRFQGLNDLMLARISPTFRALTTTGYELASGFLQLHAAGLCYRDISFGNAFFDPDTGEARICDNDNVAVNGAPSGGIIGTPRFMAPEIVRGEAPPSAATDLYSLAVLLFYMFLVAHPLEGALETGFACFDRAAMDKLYGWEPVFIFDPDNAANRPVPGLHDNALHYWPIYPQFLRDRFVQSFTTGLRDPEQGRVKDSLWKQDMARLRDAIFPCIGCGCENFYDDGLKAAAGSVAGVCWQCRQTLRLPPRLRMGRDAIIGRDAIMGRDVVMLGLGTILFPHHLDDRCPWDFSRPAARVVPHPANPSLWGLENLTPAAWVCTDPSGRAADIPPGKRVSLISGMTIAFGSKTGVIEA